MVQRLDAAKVVETLERLEARIGERFPESGLYRVCHDLVDTASHTAGRASALARPFILLRIALALVITVGISLQIFGLSRVDWAALTMNTELATLAQGLDATVNLAVLTGAGIWTLMSLESRLKRHRVLSRLHELRSFAHVIDMHQLTKDPTIILAATKPTASSPKREMNRSQLTRYLAYCSEMLAMVGKLAALYAEGNRDPLVIAAVNEIENLTADLGRKIWQKITILTELQQSADSPA